MTKLTVSEKILDPYLSEPTGYEARSSFSEDIIKLPENINILLFSGEKIKDIAMRYNFDLFQGEILASVVRDIVMGYVFLGDMTTEIEKRLKVDEKTAGEIGDALLSEIFAEHWDELQVWNVGQYRKKVDRNPFYAKATEGEATNRNQYTEDKITQTVENTKGTEYGVQSTDYSSRPTDNIATTTSFRRDIRDAIIKSGYNPKTPRLTPFLTGANRQAEILGNRDLQRKTDIRQPTKNNRIINLRSKQS